MWREYWKEASRCTIQTTFDVSFDEPLGSFPCLMDIDKGRVASLFWSESVAVSRELWFVIGFQDGAYDGLEESSANNSLKLGLFSG